MPNKANGKPTDESVEMRRAVTNALWKATGGDPLKMLDAAYCIAAGVTVLSGITVEMAFEAFSKYVYAAKGLSTGMGIA